MREKWNHFHFEESNHVALVKAKAIYTLKLLKL